VKKRKILTNQSVTRRTVIAGAAFIPIAALKGASQAPPAQAVSAPVPPAALMPADRRVLDAFIDRLIPADENGPGAVACGAGDYIDRCLADYLSAETSSIVDGLAALNAFALSSQGGAFADLSAEKRDAVLTAIDSDRAPNLRAFFNRVRRLTLEGMFSDPYWGGNRNFAGWDLIRYPGARLITGPEDQRMKTPPVPVRKSMYADGASADKQSGNKHGH
jgi:gluconate 2-dehydrogenase gamma chain